MAKQKNYSTKGFKSSEDKKKEQMTISISTKGVGDRSAVSGIDYSAAYRGVGAHGGTVRQQNKRNRKEGKQVCKNACRGIYD